MNASAQVTDIAIQDGGSITLTCGDEYRLHDGNPSTTVDYDPNMNETITICADGVGGAYVRFFADTTTTSPIGEDLDWDLHPTDTLYIYDGNSTSAPLLGAYTSPLDSGVVAQATFDNPTGCLTFQFVTDGAGQNSGFAGSVSCGYPCQPFTPLHGSTPPIFPADSSGSIKICLGDTVWFNADADFTYSSSQGGIGYNQTIENSTSIEWTISDGTSIVDEESIFFVPALRAGYFVDIKITDTLGCPVTSRTVVQVSTVPIFAEMAEVLDDTVCVNVPGVILGGVDPNDSTSVGVQPTPAEFIAGGAFSEFTHLEDGSGVNYETDISFNQFEPGQEIENASDIVDVCIVIEHTYLGDLEMMLTCPNGTSVILFNSWTGTGINPDFAGGFGGGNTYLGDPFDDPSTDPGTGWEYCFSDLSTWSTFEDEFNGGNFTQSGVPANSSMSEGTYSPEEAFANFIGCPINGDWTITVRDNIFADDGYIFEWSINFNPDIAPEIEPYTPTLVDSWWASDPTITAFLGDTAIEVTQPTAGTFGYDFFVEDDFGCVYDTTITIEVVPPMDVSATPETCIDGQTFIDVANSRDGGVWTANGPSTVAFNPDEFATNPEVEVTEEGVYTFAFYDQFCDVSDSVEVSIANTPDVSVFADTNRICDAHTLDIGASAGTSIFTGGNDLTWTPSNFVGAPFVADATDPSHYFQTDPSDSTQVSVTVSASNYCGTSSADFPFEIVECIVVTPSIFNPNSSVADNAYFQISGLTLHVGNNVKIFDRWGRKCYDVDNYHLNPWRGEKEADGVYYWILERPGYEPEVGYVHLVHGSGS